MSSNIRSHLSNIKGATKANKDTNWYKPMLAKLTHDYFSDKKWIYERKLDGVRCIIIKNGKHVRLYSRNKQCLNKYYPDLVDELKKQSLSFVADGEIIAFDKTVSSFSKLQQRMKKPINDKTEIPFRVYLYLFDLLKLKNYELLHVPLSERKALLKKYLDFSSKYICYTTHVKKDGEKYHKEACKKNWEGVIAKKSNSDYKPGRRTSNWLKFKCSASQELIIVGYKYYKNSKNAVGALLLGYYANKTLKFAGKVGTGFDQETRKELYQNLSKIEKDSSPCDDTNLPKNVNWVKPKYVAEIRFMEWTKTHKLRHPRYKGLRFDKSAKKVVKENDQ